MDEAGTASAGLGTDAAAAAGVFVKIGFIDRSALFGAGADFASSLSAFFAFLTLAFLFPVDLLLPPEDPALSSGILFATSFASMLAETSFPESAFVVMCTTFPIS